MGGALLWKEKDRQISPQVESDLVSLQSRRKRSSYSGWRISIALACHMTKCSRLASVMTEHELEGDGDGWSCHKNLETPVGGFVVESQIGDNHGTITGPR
ncbi:unnamed protein product [Cochlearia groenlandica]